MDKIWRRLSTLKLTDEVIPFKLEQISKAEKSPMSKSMNRNPKTKTKTEAKQKHQHTKQLIIIII